MLWEQWLGRRQRQLHLDRPDHHRAVLLLRRQLGRQQLRLWLQQRLRLQRRLLLKFAAGAIVSSADGTERGQKPKARTAGPGFVRVAAEPRAANRRGVTTMFDHLKYLEVMRYV